MSGGSFNYLCHKDAQDIVMHLDDVEDMADELQARELVELEAETRAILAEYKLFLENMDKRITTIAPVWRAVEWTVSGDGGDLDGAIADWKAAYVPDMSYHYVVGITVEQWEAAMAAWKASKVAGHE